MQQFAFSIFAPYWVILALLGGVPAATLGSLGSGIFVQQSCIFDLPAFLRLFWRSLGPSFTSLGPLGSGILMKRFRMFDLGAVLGHSGASGGVPAASLGSLGRCILGQQSYIFKF